ncbi:unnamed protein product [Lactuca virosa]|uniref:Secreted protein n=1 Tax=Lactuca virosa TaxID=75947 RepID=A0AAU9MTX3_9ASTR|nr:unnamed protein product [Lactuca virosa]
MTGLKAGAEATVVFFLLPRPPAAALPSLLPPLLRYWIATSFLYFLLLALLRSTVVSAHPPHPFSSLVRCCNAAFSRCCGREGCRCRRHAPPSGGCVQISKQVYTSIVAV